ncbi:MAG: hemerythrin domain-containing protein [Pseudomonadota bacterium]
MGNLIEELKQDHLEMVDVLTQIRKVGPGSQEGQALLHQAKDKLMEHLQKEDDQLYPALRKAAEDDPALKKTLSFFSRDLEKVSGVVGDFFEKYGDSEIDAKKKMQLASDFGALLTGLEIRIRKEETALYPEYEKRFL